MELFTINSRVWSLLLLINEATIVASSGATSSRDKSPGLRIGGWKIGLKCIDEKMRDYTVKF